MRISDWSSDVCSSDVATAAAPIVDVTLDDAGGGRARLTAGTAPAEAATVWLITFDDDHDTTIARGENGGRALHNSNVVRALSTLGTWSGEAVTFPLDFAAATAAGRAGCDRKSTRLHSSHYCALRMPSSA